MKRTKRFFLLIVFLLLGSIGKTRGYAAAPMVFLEVHQLNESLVRVRCVGSQIGMITNGKINIFYAQSQMLPLAAWQGEGIMDASAEIAVRRNEEVSLVFAAADIIPFEGNFLEMTFVLEDNIEMEDLELFVIVEELACNGNDINVNIGGTQYFTKQQTVIGATNSQELQAEAKRQAAAKALSGARQAGNRALSAEKATYEKGQRLYTDASWSAYKRAYQALKTAVSKNDASAMNRCRDTLTKAKAALKEIGSVNVASIRTIERTGYEKVKLAIKKTKGAKAYLIFRSAKKNGGYQLMAMTKKTSFTDGKAKAGKTYYYKAVPIKGTAGKGKKKTYLPVIGGYTNKMKAADMKKLVKHSGKARRIPMKIPSPLKIKKIGNRLKLTWEKAEGVKQVMVQYRKDGERGWKLSGKRNNKITSGEVKIPPSKYWYRVVYIWKDGQKTVTKGKAYG